jgi:bifunctional non-homologous end joining protein LigD
VATRARAGSLGEYRRKRDFGKTAEPRGRPSPRRARTLRYVIQKHDATRLHFDLRLELDGVMKSWAVPRGPSRDPSARRLAMHVEDHPIEYNTFEGVIPEGEYGAGEVIIWDRGTYTPDDGDVDAFRRGLQKGKVSFTLHGKRLQGDWSLVRMQRGDDDRQWLLLKRTDEFAVAGDDLAEQDLPSIKSGKRLSEMAKKRRPEARGQRSEERPENRAERPEESNRRRSPSRLPSPVRTLSPMLATVGSAIPGGDDWAFEPKYDGIRVLAFADGDAVSLITRNDLEKARQFPEIVDAIRALGKRRKRAFVLDGEIVARKGEDVARFQALQRRIGETDARIIAQHVAARPATLIAFDQLIDGTDVLVHEPWAERRRHLERLLGGFTKAGLQLGEAQIGEGSAMLARGQRSGWEGIMAKRVASPYVPGRRSRDWLKLKLEARQEFVVGGWTEPRKTRQHLGALLLGVWEGDRFIYVGHTGGGFTQQGLGKMFRKLERLERKTSPFETTPRTNEPAHWVRPEVVVEVKFNEWTDDGKLRQPIFVGVRDDKDPRSVVREPVAIAE